MEITNNKIINPKTSYQVFKHQPLDNQNRQSLDELYLPIIGNNAYALINQLWHSDDREHEHFELMSNLGIDGNELYNARLKLEGSSLLKVYVDESGSNKYLLENPLSSVRFFNDNLLSEVLLEMVGESQFLNLSHKLLPKQFDFSAFDNQTHNFLQAFSIHSENITNQPNMIKQVHDYTEATLSKKKQSNDINNLDFDLILNILQNSFVNIDDVKKNKALFSSTKLLYGTDEVEMAKIIEKATSLVNNHFDVQKFKILISRAHQIQFNPASQPAIGKNDESEIGSLTSQEQQLVKIAQNTAPIVFLNSLKKEKKGFATSSEERTVSQLVERNVLKSEVINILIYLLLVDRDYPTLNKNLVDTIANDWLQQGINSANQALNEIKTRDSKIDEKKVARKKQNQRKNNIRETLPDWAKNNTKFVKDEVISKEQQHKIADKLKQLKKDEGSEK